MRTAGRFFTGLGVILMLGAGGVGGLWWAWGRDLPSVSDLDVLEFSGQTRVYDRANTLVGTLTPEFRAERMPLTPSPGPMAGFDDDDFEEIGRPEGPLEERHVDPFAITEDETAETRGSEASRRSIAGPMRREGATAERHEDDADEPELRSFRRAPDPRSVQVQEPRSESEHRPVPQPRPAREPRRVRESHAEDTSRGLPEPRAGEREAFESTPEPMAPPSPEPRTPVDPGSEAGSQAAFGRRGRRRPR